MPFSFQQLLMALHTILWSGNQKLINHHYDFAVRFHIKQLHHNQLKSQGKKRFSESVISCRHSIKHAPSSCQAKKKKKLCSWSNYWTQVKLSSSNSFQNSMLSACICVQNTCPLEAHCYMDRTFVNAVTTECTEKEAYRKKIKPHSAFIHEICATFSQRFTCVFYTIIM